MTIPWLTSGLLWPNTAFTIVNLPTFFPPLSPSFFHTFHTSCNFFLFFSFFFFFFLSRERSLPYNRNHETARVPVGTRCFNIPSRMEMLIIRFSCRFICSSDVVIAMARVKTTDDVAHACNFALCSRNRWCRLTTISLITRICVCCLDSTGWRLKDRRKNPHLWAGKWDVVFHG